jgi:RNA polymerase sigma factor (TIGR02999 family)
MSRSEVTRLLEALHDGDAEALDRIFPAVYDELREIAHRHLLRERRDHTLNTTAIVHEAYLKLIANPPDVDWKGKSHFLAVAGRAMRQILVSYAKAHNAEKRGAGRADVTFEEERILPTTEPDAILALDEALQRLASLDERQVSVVECRYFIGLSIAETAAVVGASEATVNRDWATARLWLNREIRSILGSG